MSGGTKEFRVDCVEVALVRGSEAGGGRNRKVAFYKSALNLVYYASRNRGL